ncbi:hypothetical protein [Streptomyces sp. URMC 123]|uniref:hypothetical protein n=1 Tax=Streptomyces sp. URMC 123 TaxID=3423403 RepID=UPI003F1B2667
MNGHIKGRGTVRVGRCAAAHARDTTPCEGPAETVTVIDAEGRELIGCLHHSARTLASVAGTRLHPLAALLPRAADVYHRAAELPPFAWEVGR